MNKEEAWSGAHLVRPIIIMKFSEMPYERVDFKVIDKRMSEIIEKMDSVASGEELYELHKEYYDIMSYVGTMNTLASIRNSIDTTDEFYDGESEFYNETIPEFEEMINRYQKKLYESKYREFMEKKIGSVAFKNIEIGLKAFDEKLIPLMQEDNLLDHEYSKLIAGAVIDWDGEELNLSLLKKYMQSSDRNVRKKAHDKACAFYEANAEKLDEIYDKMVANRTKQAKIMGYKNYVELGYYRMNRNCYDAKMVAQFREGVKKYLVPFAEKLHELRRNELGVDRLTYYDRGVYFKDGNPAPVGTPEEILRSGQKMYSELSKETKEFFDFMMENELFDVLGRKKKRAGGYMTYIDKYKSPFIFANFNGTSGDVDVITHECGHAFNGYLTREDEIREHADITMEMAETHSMSMEFFTEPYMEMFFEGRTDDYVRMHFMDAVTFIPYGCMVDEFQHIVYENPELTPDERHATWLKLEAQYRPHLDNTGSAFYEKGGFWQQQLHIYGCPFYYIDYCIAQLCALQYKIMMDEDREKAWNSYVEFSKESARDFFTNSIVRAGLLNPFDVECMKGIVDRLEKIFFE